MAKKQGSLEGEILRRVAKSKALEAREAFDLEKLCFEQQYKFIKDPARFKVATCSRRAGKTIGIALSLIDTCLSENDVICLYATLTSKSARSIIWGDLKRLIDKYQFNVKLDETRLTIKFLDTKSEIRLGGAKDESEIEKYRGWKLRKAFIDEGQSFRPYLKYFIEDILMPSLRDLRGDLSVTGTPGPLLSGPYYDLSHSELWGQHHWTAFDNTYMLDLETTLAEERRVRGIDETEPGYIRETYGKWVEDVESLVYKFTKEKNIYYDIPDSDMEYIFGVDIGWDDSDAIAVLGYHADTSTCYLVEEYIKNKQSISQLVDAIVRLRDKYKPVKMIMDAGALGKKIQEEIRQRHSIHLEAAEKHRKFEFIELMNDDLRTGKLKARKGSRFEQDCHLVQWDRGTPGKLKISESYHTDIGDAVLYAWRECRHYFKKDAPGPKLGTDEYMRKLEDLEAEALSQKLESQKSGNDINNWGDLGVDDDDSYEDIF